MLQLSSSYSRKHNKMDTKNKGETKKELYLIEKTHS